jgi:hypothetical protein
MSEHQHDIEPMDFGDLKPMERGITNLFGKNYILREASEDAARKYRNSAVRAAKMSDGKIVGMDGVGDVQSVLVAACLFEEGSNRCVTEAVVRTWPSRVVKPMFDWVKEVSKLDESSNSLDEVKGQITPMAKVAMTLPEEERRTVAVLLKGLVMRLEEAQSDPNAHVDGTVT